MNNITLLDNDGHAYSHFMAKHISVITIMILIDIFAVAVNIFIVIAISRAVKLRSSLSPLFVVNLSILNLLAGGIILPKTIAVYVAKSWPWSHTTCIANGFLNSFLSFATIFAICVITMEKFYCIKFPMHHAGNMTVYKTVVLIILTWALAVVFAALPIMGWNLYEFNENSGCCWPGLRRNTKNQALMLFYLVAVFLLPATFIAFVNIQLYKVAKLAANQVQPSNTFSLSERTSVMTEGPSGGNICRISAIKCDPLQKSVVCSTRVSTITIQNKRISLNVQPIRVSHVGSTPLGPTRPPVQHTTPVEYSASLVYGGQISEMASNVKAFKTLVVSFASFLLFWGPYFILQTYRVMNGSTSGQHIMEPLATWLSYLSYAINPILYGYFNTQIRIECCKILQRFCCKTGAVENGVVRLSQTNVSREDFFQFLERTC